MFCSKTYFGFLESERRRTWRRVVVWVSCARLDPGIRINRLVHGSGGNVAKFARKRLREVGHGVFRLWSSSRSLSTGRSSGAGVVVWRRSGLGVDRADRTRPAPRGDGRRGGGDGRDGRGGRRPGVGGADGGGVLALVRVGGGVLLSGRRVLVNVAVEPVPQLDRVNDVQEVLGVHGENVCGWQHAPVDNDPTIDIMKSTDTTISPLSHDTNVNP